MNDIETVQRERYQPCPTHSGGWRLPDGTQPYGVQLLACCYRTIRDLPDPLADTPEGAWEFLQILKWAHGRGWRFEIDHYASDDIYQVSVWAVDHYAGASGPRPDFCAAIIAASAAAIRHESETLNESQA